MDSAYLSNLIEIQANKLGFDKTGFASADNLPEDRTYLQTWLNNGFHGEMAWMENYVDKRLDIKKLFPETESVIMVALNYYTPYKHSLQKNIAKISRYAWGNDYHKIIKKKLKKLLVSIKEHDSTIEGRIFCDTAPVQEKLWAVEAGLGWQGKNTNVIAKDMGSWFFLGGIVINKKLIYDQPLTDYCGNCTACIDACPTQALEPYALNASRCLSYITIEYWDKPIPKSISDKMERWVFGCDICQDVCPWNRFAQETGETDFYPNPANIEPQFDELLSLNEEAFKKRFKKTPVFRAKYKNFIRNIKSTMSENR